MLVRFSLVGGTAIGLNVWQANKVHAAEPSTAEQPTKKKIRPSELPIYDEPEPPQFEHVPEWDTAFHRQVSRARRWTWSYLDSIQGTTDKAKSTYAVAKAHTLDFLTYIQEDSSVLPRAAIITVSGLGGIVAGYRGGVVKKTVLAAGAMTAAAAVCYPREATEISKYSWNVASDFAATTYHDLFDSSTKTEKPQHKTDAEAKVVSRAQTTAAASTTTSQNLADVKSNKTLRPHMDFGMSKPEDKDMYTTRG